MICDIGIIYIIKSKRFNSEPPEVNIAGFDTELPILI